MSAARKNRIFFQDQFNQKINTILFYGFRIVDRKNESRFYRKCIHNVQIRVLSVTFWSISG